ncbi:MAG: YceI family protein, partial [Fulvivirga sp.]|nr:YceI family protein [Fulvivirga sp.]
NRSHFLNMNALTSLLKTTSLLVVSAFFFSLQAQSPATSTNSESKSTKTTCEVNVDVLPGSTISLEGKTNINSFNCLNCEEIVNYSSKVQVEVTNDSWKLDNAFLNIKAAGFDCEINELTRDFKELLCVESYPYLKIKVKKLKKVSTSNDYTIYNATIDLTIAGTKNEVVVPITADQQEDKVICTGQTKIDVTDFNITPPTKMFGLIKVKKEILVNFYLELQINEIAI